MKIRDVEPILLRGDQPFGSSASGAEATDNGDWQMLVRVTTDEGLVGWSDVETLAPAAVAVITGPGMGMLGFRALRDLVVGQDPLDPERLWERMFVGTAYYGRRGLAMHCISAIDNCCWSIRAQAGGMPLSTLLGGAKRDRVTAYASTLFRSTPAGMAEAARWYADRGFRAVKFGWGVFGQDAGRDEELVAAAREALGPERELLVDPGWYGAHWAEDVGPALEARRFAPRTTREHVAMCEMLAKYRVGWVEDFVHPERFDEYAEVRRQSPVPVAAGEQLATHWEFDRLIRGGCVDVAQPDLSRCGGLSVARRVAAMAADAGVAVVPHSWLTDLLTAYSLHLLAAMPAARFVEFNVSQSELTRGVCGGALRLEPDGTVRVPDGPGLGVDVDENFIQAHRVN